MDLEKTIEEFILTEVREEQGLDIDHIEKDYPLLESRLLDSLGILKLLSYLDEEFDINIAPEDIKRESFKDINTICAIIQKNT